MPGGSKIGVGYQVHLLANGLVARGHEVTVVTSCAAAAGAAYRTETVQLAGANRIFKFGWRMRNFDWSRFDLVHGHGDDNWVRRADVPHLRTVHGSCMAEALRISGARDRLRMVLLGLSEVHTSLAAHATVTVSANTRRWYPWIRTVVPNGVDLTALRPLEPAPAPMFVGTYERRKRGWLVARAFADRVRPAIPDARLWMVSEDAPEAPGTDVLGRVSAEELADRYGRAWVVCLPSTYEGFGIPYIEAMAAGCAVVATPNPGSLEVTEQGRYGVIVDAARLGDAIVELLEDHDRRDRLVAAALAHVRAYSLERVLDRYEELYGRLLTAAPTAAA